MNEVAPARARELFRAGLRVTTAGLAPGFAQANVFALPQATAAEFGEFVRRNPGPCPLLDVTEPGSTQTRLASGADLRTDLPAYRVWEDGECVADPDEVITFWRDDLVTFFTGCSFTFERALVAAGVPVRHAELGSVVPMFVTSRQCEPAGRFAGPLVVSMRPVPASLVATAAEVTSRYPAAHGAPVHAGDPAVLGITDLARPDYGEPVPLRPGEVPVFWACGVTPQAAVAAARIPFAITHAPGHMFVTDVPESDQSLVS